MMKSISVFCGSSSGNDAQYTNITAVLGRHLATQGIRLVYGGGKVGLMGILADSVLENGGEVVGVIPKFLKKKEVAHTALTQLLLTNTMQERKLKMHELSHAVIMLPGGFGTLEEFFEMATWAQLGQHQKPLGILNVDGFYDDLLALFGHMVAKGFLKEAYLQMIQVATDVEDLFDKMQRAEPMAISKWSTSKKE